MTRPFHIEHNVSTGETKEVPFSDEEFAAHEKLLEEQEQNRSEHDLAIKRLKRQMSYPPAGDQLDAAYKKRVKDAEIYLEAKAALESGNKDLALSILIQGMAENSSFEVDKNIAAVKKEIPL